MFGKSTNHNVKSEIVNKKSQLNAKNVDIKTNQFILSAAEIKAETVKIQAKLISLISQKDLDYLQKSSDSSGFLTRTVANKGHNKETKVAASIKAKKIVINNQEVITQILDKTSLTNNEKQSVNQTIATLSSGDALNKQLTARLKAQGIDLTDVTLANKSWDESTTTLSGIAKIIVQVVVAYFTAGAASGFLDAAMASLQNQFFSAAIESVITGEGLNLDPKQMLKNALTADATTYASNYISSANGLNIDKTSLQYDLANTVADAGIKTAINGGSFKDNLQNSALNTAGAKIAGKIGDTTDASSIENIISHAALGCALGKTKGGDCSSGAVGAALSAVIAPQMAKAIDKDGDGLDADEQAQVKALTQISVALIANVANKNLDIANYTALNEVSNNYLSHAEDNRKKELIEKRSQCITNGNCSKEDIQKYTTEIQAIKALDKKRDTDIKKACSENPSSPTCVALIADFKDKQQSYDSADKKQSIEYKNNLDRLKQYELQTKNPTTNGMFKGIARLLKDTVIGTAELTAIIVKASAGDKQANQQLYDMVANLDEIPANIQKQWQKANELEKTNPTEAAAIRTEMFASLIGIAGVATKVVKLIPKKAKPDAGGKVKNPVETPDGDNVTGGPHKKTTKPVNDGLDSHHCPAKDCYKGSLLSSQDGPAIKIDPIDHRKTASYGSSPDAKAYRAKQKKLVEQGKFKEAQQMDIDDLRSKFGNKYDDAIKQMMGYTKTIDTNSLKK